MPPPLIAIVGRPNVGKSSLFNALIRKRLAIVEPTPGVTRDRLYAEAEAEGKRFRIADTGGVGVVDRQDLAAGVQTQVRLALEEARAIVFVTDVQEGDAPLDRAVADLLRTTGKPVLPVANKADHPALDDDAAVFYRFGFGDPLPVSAEQRRNLGELMEWIAATLPGEIPAEEGEGEAMKLCVVGRRNAGKSTLINALAGGERVLVSETPGTTRDAVDVTIERGGRTFTIVDTAGVRKRSKLQDSVEFYAQTRTEAGIRRSDVTLLLLDALSEIGAVDKKIASYVIRHHKACVICVNKWDAVPAEAGTDRYTAYVRDRLRGLAFAPLSFLSALSGLNVGPTFDLALELGGQRRLRAPTAEVNRVLREAMQRRSPPPRSGRLPKIFYATQTDVAPPTVVLFANDPSLLKRDYLRYLENRFREELPFSEVPVRLVLRKRGKGA